MKRDLPSEQPVRRPPSEDGQHMSTFGALSVWRLRARCEDASPSGWLRYRWLVRRGCAFTRSPGSVSEGVKADELRHVALLAIPTLGSSAVKTLNLDECVSEIGWVLHHVGAPLRVRKRG